jgi:hypothetical protein
MPGSIWEYLVAGIGTCLIILHSTCLLQLGPSVVAVAVHFVDDVGGLQELGWDLPVRLA